MTTNFPGTLDTTATLSDPTVALPLGDPANTVKHGEHHQNLADAVRALETRAGIDGTGQGGGGNGAITGQLIYNVPPSFASGTTLTGSNTTHAKIAGDQTAYVGFYYVALGVANNPSVPITSATFDGTNTTLVIPFVTSHTSGQSYEISFFPGGTSGRERVGDTTAVVFKPPADVAVLQLGPTTAVYQADAYGTLYFIGLGGTGANGSHFRDARFADIGVEAIENTCTFGSTAPAGTVAARTLAELIYNGGQFMWLRTNNGNGTTTRDISHTVDGDTGHATGWAAAATSGATKNTSPRFRLLGTYWDGAASNDLIGYVQVDPTDTSGGVSMEWGFEHRGSPHVRLVDGATAFLQPFADAAAGLGGTSNRWSQVIAAGASGQGFRVFNVGEANPTAELRTAGLMFGLGAGSATDTTIARAAAGAVMVPMLVKAGVPADGDFAATPANGAMAINSLTDVIYYRKAGVWTATTA